MDSLVSVVPSDVELLGYLKEDCVDIIDLSMSFGCTLMPLNGCRMNNVDYIIYLTDLFELWKWTSPRAAKNDHLSNRNSKIRQKREWIIPPAIIPEEDDSLKINPVVRINSDRANNPGVVITYAISGQGVTEPPYGLFVINGKTGELNITRKVDREKYPEFLVRGHALDQNGNKAEEPIDLRIRVSDINDNYPVFSTEVFIGSVEELSELGTLVMRINATDADEPNNLNSKIAFKILQNSDQSSAFNINSITGDITARLYLDREKQSSYTLTVEAKDRAGDKIGLATTCTVRIKILDVNDNVPVLERQTYEGSVEENRANVEIMRLKVSDKDEIFSDNWLANFTIASGNEGGYFRIVTNAQTNEGVLTLVKELNYEEMQSMNLNVVVTNKAAFHKSVSNTYKEKRIPVTIKVKNVIEGPLFKPHTVVIKTSETMTINQIIGRFQAYDEDTSKVAEHITYVKKNDIDNWIMIDSTTAEIRLIKIPDYESSYVINGTYTATILAISKGYSKKTATGTIVIQVTDANDNCPTIVTPAQTVCSDAKFFSFTAEDRDAYPNSAPFTFTVIDEPEGMAKKWVIGDTNATTMQLLLPQDVKPSINQVKILVKDMLGLSCAEKQILTLTVCTCVNGGSCQDKQINSSVWLGGGAIALIILAILLLLLVPLLLLFCHCGSRAKGFTAIPHNSEEMLRKWNSEGAAPEDKAMLTLIAPTAFDNSAANVRSGAAAAMGAEAAATGGGSSQSHSYGTANMSNGRWEEQRHLLSGAKYGAMGAGGAMAAEGTMAAGGTMTMRAGGTTMIGAGRAMTTGPEVSINEEFLRDYFNEKADTFADEDEVQLANDCLLLYCQEEAGSSHGSIGCCSFIEDDLDDRFLDDLGDKFKTLADICLGKHAEVEASQHNSHVLKDRNASPAVNESGLCLNDALPQFLDQQNAFSSEHTYSLGTSFQPLEPVHRVNGIGSETVTRVLETSYASRPGLKQARPIADPLANSNVIVTETSYADGPIVRPTTGVLDPQFLVTERVLAPASGLQDMLENPNGRNVRVTERLIRSDDTMPGVLKVHDFPDSQYVVVRERERLLVPSSDLKAPLSIPNLSEGQNVVITERVVTPTSGLQASYTTPAEVSGMQSIGGQTTISGPGRQERILITDPLFNQTGLALEDSSTVSKSSKVTKYSTVQYTRS
ncbi:CKLF-like MARVEL transmembrane domain-containing protein 8 [Platysternon megacephalum]|uniref:CKLF-like MARVEL transmembrane domain-containing protein 8 n=1 Tax=Platysternon megacephalum TaxID=55544 RepID=A0A4D9EVQ0_9SAUR|nr:CKLF-like MARVEL transmembrane domain-containing protein 8 [Platysternon megacephalum]